MCSTLTYFSIATLFRLSYNTMNDVFYCKNVVIKVLSYIFEFQTHEVRKFKHIIKHIIEFSKILLIAFFCACVSSVQIYSFIHRCFFPFIRISNEQKYFNINTLIKFQPYDQKRYANDSQHQLEHTMNKLDGIIILLEKNCKLFSFQYSLH